MGKTVGRQPEAPAVTPAGSAGGRESIGRYLAQQRKLRGLSLDELSTQTRIPRRSLERLEGGAFDRAPDGFARGFVRTVAEAIGLDPDETVARMLAEPAGAARSLPRARGAAFALIGVALVALLAYAASHLGLWSSSEPEVAAPEAGLPVWRDYVRELAEARGLAPATLEAADAALPPEPPAPEVPEGELAAPELANAPAAAPAARAAAPAAIAPRAAAPVAASSAPLAAPPLPPEATAAEPLAEPAAGVAGAAATEVAGAAETTAAEPAPPAPVPSSEPLAAGAPLEEGTPASVESPASAPAAPEAPAQAAPEAPAQAAPAAEASEVEPVPSGAASERAEDPD